MLALVAYDIPCNRTRQRLHKFLKEFGINSQKSVFECEIDTQALEKIKNYARTQLDPEEDCLRIYWICERCKRKVAVSGQGIKLVTTDYLVVD